MITAALVTAAISAPSQGTYAAWSKTTTLVGVPNTYAAVSLKATMGSGSSATQAVSAVYADGLKLDLPAGLLAPLAGSASTGVAVPITVSGYAQGTQSIAWKVKTTTATKGYTDAQITLITVTDTASCTPAAKGSATLSSGGTLAGLTGMPEQTLDDATYSTSTTPTTTTLCAIFTRPKGASGNDQWSSAYLSEVSASATSDDGTAVTAPTPATWSAVVDRDVSSIDGTGSITLTWRTPGTGA